MTIARIFVFATIFFGLAGCASKTIYPIVQITPSDKISAAAITGQVSEDNLRSNIKDIFNTRRFSISEREMTLASIEAKAWEYDYWPVEQSFSFYGYEGRNIILTKVGQTNPDDWVVIMAHYDSVYNSPGSDDNGSGCAALLEIARIFSNVYFGKTIKLVFVDLEELGFGGSRFFVSHIPEGTNIIAAISLEMIGYTSSTQLNPFPAPFDINKGDFLAVIGDGKSFSIANDFVRNIKQNDVSLPTVIINPDDVIHNYLFLDLMRSDHYAFWESGLPAIMITDTANFRNTNYHNYTDSIDTLDFAFLRKTTQATAMSAYLWAGVVSQEAKSDPNYSNGAHFLMRLKKPGCFHFSYQSANSESSLKQQLLAKCS